MKIKIPKIAVIFSVSYIIVIIFHVIFSQLYEEGISRLILPILDLGIISIAFFFLLGQKWAYSWLVGFAIATIIINLIFDFGRYRSDLYGNLAQAMMIFYGIELLISILLLYSLLRRDVKELFNNS